MEQEILEKRRNEIGYKISDTMYSSFRRTLYVSKEDDHEFFRKCDETINFFEDLFDKKSEEELYELLSGDFAKDYIGNKEHFNTSKMPLYFFIDIIISSIKQGYLKYDEYEVKCTELLDRLRTLRSKLTKYNNNKFFEPDKTTSPVLLEKIYTTKGYFSINPVVVRGNKYLNIDTTMVHENVEYRYGEYIPTGPTTYSHSSNLVYEEDKSKIDAEERAIAQEQRSIIDAKCGKYFIDGKFPSYDNFHSSLIDAQNMDENIRLSLFSIAYVLKDKYILNCFAEIEEYIRRVESREQYLLEEERKLQAEKEHTAAIDSARSRYYGKNFLWRFVNRKISPERIAIEDMKTEEINALYGGVKK